MTFTAHNKERTVRLFTAAWLAWILHAATKQLILSLIHI